ncbi:unnamed protein product [Brachionus calyciflorus]|uniref:Uncharacterized protein n=1 Tax=Brachionus calyciflorus TaxID=104777 RepID=A0A813ZQ28_9BILA|nr:unnamed protein product [Brachionus calyciflorus]
MKFLVILFISSLFVINQCSVIPKEQKLTVSNTDNDLFMKTNLLDIAIFGIQENSFKNTKSENSDHFLKKIELIKNVENPRCTDCFNAAYYCYYSSGSWFNSECTYAYSAFEYGNHYLMYIDESRRGSSMNIDGNFNVSLMLH